MPQFDTMADEQVLEQAGGSFLVALLSSLVPSLLTLFIYPFLVAKNSGVAVTDQRIIVKNGGLLGASTDEVRLDNVQGVRSESVFLFGNQLAVSNAAGETFNLPVGNPDEIRRAINRAQN